MYDLDDYWRKIPPVHVLVAAFLGYKPPNPPGRGGATRSRSKDDVPPIEELMAMFGPRS